MCRVRTKRSKTRHEAAFETASDTECEAGDGSLILPKSSSSSERYNAQGMRVNCNNVVSLRHLPLAMQVPTKTRDEGTMKCFGAAHTLSKAYTLFTLIVNGSKMPVEKQRDSVMQMMLLRSAGPYCLSKESKDTLLEADTEELHAYLTGLAKNAQQITKYNVYGIAGNFLADKVLTQHDVFPSETVKKHLGLTGEHATKSFMDM